MKNNITFRYPKISDVDELTRFMNELSREQTYIRFQGKQLTVEEEKEYLKGFLEDIKNNRAVKIIALDEKKIVGAADIRMDFGANSHVGVFGIVIAKDYRDQGLGKTLIQKTIDEAKQKIKDLKIITLSVFANNNRAKHIYEKFGFKEYGTLPKGVFRKGEYIDHIYLYKEVTSRGTS